MLFLKGSKKSKYFKIFWPKFWNFKISKYFALFWNEAKYFSKWGEIFWNFEISKFWSKYFDILLLKISKFWKFCFWEVAKTCNCHNFQNFKIFWKSFGDTRFKIFKISNILKFHNFKIQNFKMLFVFLVSSPTLFPL